MENPVEGMIEINKELKRSLKEMAKCKNLDEREIHSRIVKNLTVSFGVYLNFLTGIAENDFDPGFYEDDEF